MANEILNSLLKEYEHKRTYAELDLIKRKENLYKLIPEFQEIDDEILQDVIENHLNDLIDFARKMLNKNI